MEKWVYFVHTNCLDPAREKEFNDWYDKVHLPERGPRSGALCQFSRAYFRPLGLMANGG